MTLTHVNTLAYAMICGALCFVIAFMYQRQSAKYKFVPSLIAYAIAAKTGVEWLMVMGSILLYGYWPSISPVATALLGILLIIAIRERGNVARILGRLPFVRATV